MPFCSLTKSNKIAISRQVCRRYIGTGTCYCGYEPLSYFAEGAIDARPGSLAFPSSSSRCLIPTTVTRTLSTSQSGIRTNETFGQDHCWKSFWSRKSCTNLNPVHPMWQYCSSSNNKSGQTTNKKVKPLYTIRI